MKKAKTTLTDLDKKLIEDLKIHKVQSSWDWPADYRYAKIVNNDEIDILGELLASNAPTPIQMAVHDTLKTKGQRLRHLRKLVKAGIVESWWSGTGFSGYYDFGVRRTRGYELINKS